MEITLSINNRYIDKDLTKIAWGWENKTLNINTLSQYIQKGIGYSSGVIKKDYKTKKAPTDNDIDSAEIMIIDIDNETGEYVSLENFCENKYIKEHAVLLHETARSTSEKNRFRAIFLLDKPINNIEYKKIAKYFQLRYNSDNGCLNISKKYAGNSKAKCILLGNKKIDVDSTLYNITSIEKRKEVPKYYDNNKKIEVSFAEEMLQRIPKKQDYKDWLAVCMDILNYFGETNGVKLIQGWSPSLNSYGKENTLEWAKQVNTKSIDFPATLYSYAKKYGWEDKNLKSLPKTSTKSLNKKKTDSKDDDSKNNKLNDIYDYLNKLGKFKINRLTNQLELYKNNKMSIITDYEINSYWSDMYKKGIYTSVSPQMLHQILSSNFVERYDPIVDYFNSLPEWNKEDQFEILFSCLSISPEIIETCKDYFKKWYVGAIAQALNIGQNHLCLVLHGGQGIGKNTLMRHLTPPPLKTYFEEKNIDPNNPDDRVLTTKMLFIMMDELEGVTKKDMHSLKSIMTQQKFNIRLPYARRHEDYNRRASFCAGVNREEFLNDITGNRRFIVVPIDDNINLTKLEFIDVNQLYAQCYHLLKQGYKYWYDGIEIRELNERNKRFALPSSEEDFIQKYFTPGDKDDNISSFMTPTDILKHIKDQSGEKLYPNIIGKALTNLGYKKVVHKRQYGYFVKIINQNMPDNSYNYKIH